MHSTTFSVSINIVNEGCLRELQKTHLSWFYPTRDSQFRKLTPKKHKTTTNVSPVRQESNYRSTLALSKLKRAQRSWTDLSPFYVQRDCRRGVRLACPASSLQAG